MASQRGAHAGSSWENPIDLGSDDDEVDEVHDDDNDENDKKEADQRWQEAIYQDYNEKRLRRFRPQPPHSFNAVYDRAMTQRFCVLWRARGGDGLCPEESFLLAGSTGNVYTIKIARQPRCDCQHALGGNQCKHVIFVLARVLQAPFNLVYQLALLSSELRIIFAAAWREEAPLSAPRYHSSTSQGGVRRRAIEGDCPICFCELKNDNDAQSVVWCIVECGQNFHRQCMNTWIEMSEGPPACPMCRRPWMEELGDGTPVLLHDATFNEGYANVGHSLGMSSVRDTSSYSNWVPLRSRPHW